MSKILGIPAASVRSRLARARTLLEKQLKGGIADENGIQKRDEQDKG